VCPGACFKPITACSPDTVGAERRRRESFGLRVPPSRGGLAAPSVSRCWTRATRGTELVSEMSSLLGSLISSRCCRFPLFWIKASRSARRGREPGRRQAAPAAFGAGAESHRLPPDRRPAPVDPASSTMTAGGTEAESVGTIGGQGFRLPRQSNPGTGLPPAPLAHAADTSPQPSARSLHALPPAGTVWPPTRAFAASEGPSPGKIDLPTICPQPVVDGWTQPDSARQTTTAPDQHLCCSGAASAPGGG